MDPRVGLVPCDDYNDNKVYESLCDAVSLAGGIDADGKTVLLKPNILFDAPPEKALTTHPAFLKAAIKIVREAGASRILVGDSPGLQKPGFSGRKSGLRQVSDEMECEWVDFTKSKYELECPEGKVSRSFTVSGVLQEADMIISLPKLKTHQLMYFTGALKNMFGLVPSLLKSPFHLSHPSREGFAAMIVDLNTGISADFAMMDGIIGMEGHGPAAGSPRKAGIVLASSNLLALDITASGIIGYPPESIPINREALSRGIWLNSMDEIKVKGLKIEEAVIKDFRKIQMGGGKTQVDIFLLPNIIRKIRDRFTPVPVFSEKTCVYCGDCIRICPAGALEFSGKGSRKKIEPDYTKCIRCYCCHEVCQVNAIDIHRKPFKTILPVRPYRKD